MNNEVQAFFEYKKLKPTNAEIILLEQAHAYFYRSKTNKEVAIFVRHFYHQILEVAESQLRQGGDRALLIYPSRRDLANFVKNSKSVIGLDMKGEPYQEEEVPLLRRIPSWWKRLKNLVLEVFIRNLHRSIRRESRVDRL